MIAQPLRSVFRLRDRKKQVSGLANQGRLPMKHEPQQPIRPRMRGMPRNLATASAGQQATRRVVIRVPLVETGTALGRTDQTTSEPTVSSALPVAAKPQAPTADEGMVRIDAAHDVVPSPHAIAISANPTGGWLAGVLQKKTLLAIGLIIS